MGSCGRRGAGCPCDSEKSWSNIQLRRKYKEGNYDRGHFDGSPVQQQPHQGSGGAHQDQRVCRQLPALRPHRLQLREQGQPDRVQPGGVQGNQLPRWLTCPNIAWKLLPRHKPLPSKKTARQSGAWLSSAQMARCLRFHQVDAALPPCSALERIAPRHAHRQSALTAELPPPPQESVVRILFSATKNASARGRKSSANLSSAPMEILPLCQRGNVAPPETFAPCNTVRAYLVLQRDVPPEILLRSLGTHAAQARLSATTRTALMFVALSRGAATAQ